MYIPVETPGERNLCLYNAVLISSLQPCTETASLSLKAAAHRLLKEKLTEARSTTGLTRSDLRAALDVTDPRTELMATDEVVPAIATLLNCKVFIHEEGSVIEVEDYDAVAENELHIGYEPGHFYGLKKE